MSACRRDGLVIQYSPTSITTGSKPEARSVSSGMPLMLTVRQKGTSSSTALAPSSTTSF